MSIDDIKAGSYELIAAQFDQITSKPGEPFDYTRYTTGDIVTLDVAEARRLFSAGAVIKPGEREKAQANAARAAYEAALAALSQEERDEVAATLAAQAQPVEPEPVTTPVVTGPVAPVGGGAPVLAGSAPAGSTEGSPDAGDAPAAPVRPQQVAAKALWVDYRIGQGMPAEAAEGATKNQLIKAEPPTFEIIGE